ncbi:hypothetical protein C8R47DRAFT_1199500 [Mycena vitilis]|nr:hypothetical protein C8R47DRAFT_1199500 [Mycena vitilis]
MPSCLWALLPILWGFLPTTFADEACLDGHCENQPHIAPVVLFFIVFGSFAAVSGGVLIFVYFWRRRTDRFQQQYLQNAYADILSRGEVLAADPLLPYAPGGADEYYRTHHRYPHMHRNHGHMNGMYMSPARFARDIEAMEWERTKALAMHAPMPMYPVGGGPPTVINATTAPPAYPGKSGVESG